MKNFFFYSFLIGVLSFLTFSICQLFYITDKDRCTYQRFAKTQEKVKVVKKEPVHQERTNVQKDIWYLENGMRLHLSIFSSGSSLSLREKNGRLELEEELKNIRCLAQEKVFLNPLTGKWEQKLKYFTAEKGIYLFPSHQFSSDIIKLYFYDIEGACLPSSLSAFSPYLQGTASEVAFRLSEKTSHFKAYHFKAFFDTAQEIQ